MARLWEKTYPYSITIILLVLYQTIFKESSAEIIRNNSANLLTSVITLSSVFLGFVCAMLGVLISIKNTLMYDFLKSTKALSDLVQYIKEACFFDFVTLIISIIFLLFLPSPQGSPLISDGLSSIQIYSLLFCSSVMILSSLRMILILFEFINTKDVTWNNKKNLAKEERITPKDI